MWLSLSVGTNGFFSRRIRPGFRQHRGAGNAVQARLLRAHVGFGRPAPGASTQEDQDRGEAALVQLDAAIGPALGFQTQHAGRRHRSAEHDDGVRVNEVGRDGHP